MKAFMALPFLAACLFPMTRHDSAAHARRVEQLCGDANFAYEAGYNDGLARKRLDTSWSQSCAPAYQQEARASYHNGYTSGIEHAPIVVRGVGGGGARTYSSAETCTFSSDCGEGRSCRRDNSGTNVCMGGGYAGEPCWFSSDCVSDSCDGSTKTCR
jgi:hypothetical protein